MTVPVKDALRIRREHAAVFGTRESGVKQPVAMEHGELDKLAHSLAYESAETIIQSESYACFDSTEGWRDVDPEGEVDLVDALRYLELRGLLEHHPKKPNLVRVLDESEAVFGVQELGVQQLVAALVHYSRQLATSKIYLDPRDDRPEDQVSAFCSECLRGGINGKDLDHAPSCVAGRVLELIADIDRVSAPPQTPNERTDANHSDALTEQEGGSAEGQARISLSDLSDGLDRIWPVIGNRPLVEGRSERTIEYFPVRHSGELDLPGDGATA